MAAAVERAAHRDLLADLELDVEKIVVGGAQTARAMAHYLQLGTAREAELSAAETGRLVYSRSSFDRVAHAVGEHYADRNVDIEDALISSYQPPDESRSISVGLDRVSLPMIEPRALPPGLLIAA